jgi:hypothetical protein
MCADLSLNRWYILRDNAAFSNYITPVLPAFPEATNGNQSWITSQSSYHNISQLPSGQWLAFMRGTCSESGTYTRIGIATSTDGINWYYLPEGDSGSGNPVISQTDGLTPIGSIARGQGNYRPHFMLYLGLLDAYDPLATLNSLYQGVWSEATASDSGLRLISGKMPDSGTYAYLFPAAYRASTDEYLAVDPPDSSQLETSQDGTFVMDGAFSPLRIGNYLYIFIGKDLYRIDFNQL